MKSKRSMLNSTVILTVAVLLIITLVVSACVRSTGGMSEFPTGTFVSTNGTPAVEFYEDGTGSWTTWNLPFKYAVNGDLYTEMTFEYPSGLQVPATYYWTYDGENLTFELWGEDMRPHRQSVYEGHTYIKSE